jgi:hypothetical protein
MSLAGGLFFLFLVGGLFLNGTLRGFGVGAGGGVAVFFLMQFVVNPVPGCTGPTAKGVEWTGGEQLGALIDTLRRQRAAGQTLVPRIEVSPADEDRITHFNPKLDRVAGKSWPEVFQRICDSTNGCLVCEISKDRETVKLSTQGNWTKTATEGDPKNYSYACR